MQFWLFLLQPLAELSKASYQNKHTGKYMGKKGNPPFGYMNVFLLKL